MHTYILGWVFAIYGITVLLLSLHRSSKVTLRWLVSAMVSLVVSYALFMLHFNGE